MWEGLNIYRPGREYKTITFNVTKPEQIRDDKLVIKNEYYNRPEQADIHQDIPEWGYDLFMEVNRTPERMKLLSNTLANFRIPN